jgi:gas vesicle protein
MIKTFEQFINENYNNMKVVTVSEEYGAPLFDEVSESLMSEINNSINEGKLTIDANMIEEGLFDAIGNLFKKGADKMNGKVEDANTDAEVLKQSLKDTIDLEDTTGKDIEWYGKEIKQAEFDAKVYAKIEELCKSAEEICARLAEKEEAAYKTISEKMTAANEAIKEFTEKSIVKIKEIAEISKNKVADIIAAVLKFLEKMGAYAKNALEAIGKGVVLGFSLPFIFAFSVYKGAVKVCEMLVEKIKDGAKVVKEAFGKVKTAIVNWVKDMLTKAQDLLKRACDAVVDGAKKAYQAVAKSFLAIVAVLGQLASDAKDAISNAYNSFVESVKEFADDVKAYISEKWDVVSSWCKKTATAFADGVKNVWNKLKDKVTNTIGAIKDAYKTLKDNANATWDEIQEWNDERQQEDIKAKLKYAADKWGKDTVASWVDSL